MSARGPKTAQRMWKELDITSVDELADCAAHEMERGDFTAADHLLRQGLAREPGHPACRAYQAVCLAALASPAARCARARPTLPNWSMLMCSQETPLPSSPTPYNQPSRRARPGLLRCQSQSSRAGARIARGARRKGAKPRVVRAPAARATRAAPRLWVRSRCIRNKGQP